MHLTTQPKYAKSAVFLNRSLLFYTYLLCLVGISATLPEYIIHKASISTTLFSNEKCSGGPRVIQLKNGAFKKKIQLHCAMSVQFYWGGSILK